MLTQPELDMVKYALDTSSAAYQTLVYGTRVEGIIDGVAAVIVICLSIKMCSTLLQREKSKHKNYVDINDMSNDVLIAIAGTTLLYIMFIGCVIYVISEAILPIAMPDYVVIRNVIDDLL